MLLRNLTNPSIRFTLPIGGYLQFQDYLCEVHPDVVANNGEEFFKELVRMGKVEIVSNEDLVKEPESEEEPSVDEPSAVDQEEVATDESKEDATEEEVTEEDPKEEVVEEVEQKEVEPAPAKPKRGWGIGKK